MKAGEPKKTKIAHQLTAGSQTEVPDERAYSLYKTATKNTDPIMVMVTANRAELKMEV